MVMLLAIPTQASAAVKISKKSVTLIKGQSVTLKVTGTKSKAKWSSSKKSIATVSSKGKVVAKKKGTATITAKIGKKKYTCKVKVETPKLNKSSIILKIGEKATLKVSGTSQKIAWKSSNESIATVGKNGIVTAKREGTATITATVLKKKYLCSVTIKNSEKEGTVFNEKTAQNNISKKVININNSVFVIMESKYDCPTGISAKCDFYDEYGNPVDYSSDSISFLEKSHTGILQFNYPSIGFSTYKITYEYSEGLKYLYHKSVIDKMAVSANLVNSEYGNYLMLTVQNSNSYECYSGEIAIIYYGQNGEIVAIEKEYTGEVPANSSKTVKSYVPYDSKTYEDIEYQRYDVFISYAYHLGK